MVVDELLHSVIPIMVIIYWRLFADKVSLHWRALPWYLIYPLTYLIYILVRGEFSGFYPYPFINVDQLGWATIIRNMLGLFGVILFLSALFIGWGKMIHQGKKT